MLSSPFCEFLFIFERPGKCEIFALWLQFPFLSSVNRESRLLCTLGGAIGNMLQDGMIKSHDASEDVFFLRCNNNFGDLTK